MLFGVPTNYHDGVIDFPRNTLFEYCISFMALKRVGRANTSDYRSINAHSFLDFLLSRYLVLRQHEFPRNFFDSIGVRNSLFAAGCVLRFVWEIDLIWQSSLFNVLESTVPACT